MKPLNLLMKLRSPLYILAALLFSFVSCTKEVSNENGGNGPVSSDFYATVDGIQWNADSLQLIDASNGQISILGLSKTGAEIDMSVPEFKTGTYTLNAQSVPIAAYGNIFDPSGNIYLSNVGTAGGTITISSIDTISKMMSGSFQFTLTNPSDNISKTITKGIFFNIPYTGGTGGVVIPPSNSGDTLTALVDGIKFTSAVIEPTSQNGQLFIAGITSDGTRDLALIMPTGITPGTYNLDFATGMYIGAYTPSSTEALISQSNGTLTIISNDVTAKRIKGTFSFIASSLMDATTATITQGYFSVSY
jgi:hypothetical protein